MSPFDTFVQRNRAFAAGHDLSHLTAMPSGRVFVVTCLDPRVEPAGFLGIDVGEAIVMRNPGGRITDAAITDIALISFFGEVLGGDGPPIEVAVVHHTACGMGLLADAQLRADFSGRSGVSEAELAAQAVTDPRASVREDVARLLASPLATSRFRVSGHVLDLQTGLVETVARAAAPQQVAPTSS